MYGTQVDIISRIDGVGSSVLEALGYTGNIADLTARQVDLILSLQSMNIGVYQRIDTQEYQILLHGKSKQGGHLDIKKWKERFFSSRF